MGLGANFTFAVREASRSLFRHRGRAFSAIGSITASMLILGTFGIVVQNLDRALSRLGAQFRIAVFLQDDLTTTQRSRLEAALRAQPGVEAIRFVSKEEAYEEFSRSFSGIRDLLQGIQGNPLPASYLVTLKEGFLQSREVERLARTFSQLPGVEDLEYGQKWVERFEALVTALRIVGIAVGAVLGLAILFLIATSTKISLYRRQEELEILRRIGASRPMIRMPFLLEGAALGAGGALLALALLAGSFWAFQDWLGLTVSLLGSTPPVFFPREIMGGGIAAGGLLGLIGSFLAARPFLKES